MTTEAGRLMEETTTTYILNAETEPVSFESETTVKIFYNQKIERLILFPGGSFHRKDSTVD